MGVLDKFLNVMRLNPDDDDEFYNDDYDYDDDYEEDEPVKTKSSFRKEKKDDYEEEKVPVWAIRMRLETSEFLKYEKNFFQKKIFLKLFSKNFKYYNNINYVMLKFKQVKF